MKIRQKHWLRCAVVILALITVLSGCGGLTVSPASEAEPTAAPEGNAQAAETAQPRSLADIYERTDADGIYRLNTVITDGYGVESAQLRDGFVLLLMRDYSEQGFANEAGVQHLLSSGRLVLFPLNAPENAVSSDFERFDGSITLLDGGAAVASGWDGSYTLYNSSLEEVCKAAPGCGSFLGASGNGDIWFVNDASAFVLYRDGKQVLTVPAEGMRHGSYVGDRDGKAYFTMFNEYYGWTFAVVDVQGQTFSESSLLSDVYDAHNGLLCYNSEDRWYIAGMEDPLTVTAFTKPYSDESVMDMDERYLIGSTYKYDEAVGNFRQSFRIYDMQNGGLCAEKSDRELSALEVSMRDYCQGMMLFETHDMTMKTGGLYLWDFSALSAQEPAKSYERIDHHVDQSRIDELIREIYDRYGVTVYYDQEHLNEYSTDYSLIACPDTEMIGYTLVKLKECMAEYPEGFFEEIKGESMQNVVFCLCDKHDRVDTGSIEDASATVTTIGDTLRMSIDVHYRNGLRRIFLHENTHMMETRLAEEMAKISSKNFAGYWYTEMNLPDCPPIQQYIWEQTEENMKGVYSVDPENACYIDWYSKCTINEDHARTMENGIYSGTAYYYSAPYIDRKSRFLNAAIRAAFPCVQNCPDGAFWEQRTGMVDLYQEFPDFFAQG